MSYYAIFNRKGKRRYGDIFPDHKVPVTTLEHQNHNFQKVYYMDHTRLTDHQKEQIITQAQQPFRRLPKKTLLEAEKVVRQQIETNQAFIHKKFFKKTYEENKDE